MEVNIQLMLELVQLLVGLKVVMIVLELLMA
jgi:hypothetical protein